MNCSGIALAADSAVTVGSTSGKIYTSADKLFQLAQDAPVGIMIYGNATFMNIPWETLIKIYRKKLGNRTFPLLKDYTDNFIRFIKSQKKMFPLLVQKSFASFIARDIFSYIRDRLKKQLEKELDSGKVLQEKNIKLIFRDLVRDQLIRTKKAPRYKDLPTSIAKIVRKKYRKEITAARRNTFEKLPISQAIEHYLEEIVSELLTRRRLENGSWDSTGIVIAGFGEKEHYPLLVEFIMPGVIAGYPLYAQTSSVEIGTSVKGCQACVAPFAQKEMVHTFMRGIDPDLKAIIEKSTSGLFNKATEVIIKQIESKYPNYTKKIRKKIGKNLEKLLSDLLKFWENTRVEKYSDPVMEMVASLPKDELGAMAESLVNLTKFKRRWSKQQETVGGPIDAAVITKGDGFVWVKRKHYFPPELNPRFLAHLNKK